ncbi:unnamed protein product, partial [Sphacelaria rigidula]
RGISLGSHAGKVILEIVATRLGAYCELKKILPGAQCGFQPDWSPLDMMYVVRRLHELDREKNIQL